MVGVVEWAGEAAGERETVAGLTILHDLAIVALVAGIAGLICRRVGLSAVVGYLAAGMLIGPHTPLFQLVEDAEKVRSLADLGLVFLIFGIGLGFSLPRMRRLGVGMIVATGAGALLVLAGVRLVAALFGLSTEQGLFIAAVLMVSSSAIISKVLEEIGSNHTRWGQLALGVTLLEDIVAVVMLTLLASVAPASEGAGEGQSVWQALTSFTGFAAVLFVVVLLLVPRMLRRLKRSATEELLMLVVTGLLLVLGVLAVRLGYSMALTAFILGAIIGSTPQRPDVERLFEGIRHLFGAVFFVAMGMMFNVGGAAAFWPGMLALAAAAILLRVPATALALTLAGNTTRDSLRAGLALTPLGEFSYVIAFLGVQTGVMSETFYPAAVGASLLTCVLSPMLIKRAEPLSDRIDALLPAPVRKAVASYHEWLEGVQQSSAQSELWQQMAPVLARAIVYLLIVAGCVAVVTPAFELAVNRYGTDLLFPTGTTVLFVLVTGAVVLGPLLAAWRNLSLLSALIARATARPGMSGTIQGLIERGFLIVLCLLVGLWLLAVMPAEAVASPPFFLVIALLAVVAFLVWRNLDQVQEKLEAQLRHELEGRTSESTVSPQWTIQSDRADSEWALDVREVPIPTNGRHAGRTLAELNLRRDWHCSVVGIDRQGFAISNPRGSERLYPGDRVLLLGPEEKLAATAAHLAEVDEQPGWANQFDELATEFVAIPAMSPCVGMTLRELDPVAQFGIQVGGIRRGQRQIVTPNADERLRPGDHLMLLGTHAAVRRFRDFIAAPSPSLSDERRIDVVVEPRPADS